MNLERFLAAQTPVYANALAELRAGRKQTHWIWFILPQLRALGHSRNATFYGLENAAEAAAYLAHPVLGARLRECVAAIQSHGDKSAHDILGSPDDLKFRSCLTLFRSVATPDDHLWKDALNQFYSGQPDDATLRLLSPAASS